MGRCSARGVHWKPVTGVMVLVISLCMAITGRESYAASRGAERPPARLMVAQADQQDFDIPAQPLGQALTQFGVQTNYRVLYNADVTEGRSTGGVSGRYSAEEALSRLLEGTGVTSTKTNPKEITLHTVEPLRRGGSERAEDEKPLETREIVVKGASERGEFKPLGEEATAEDGYRPETISGVGPFARRKIEDTPYSVSVVSKELMQNLQMSRTEDIYRVHPLTKPANTQNLNNLTNLQVRGLNLNPLQMLHDGFRTGIAFGPSLEEMERVEIFSGLSGFLYGGGHTGGTVNFVLKRPTPEPMATVRVGNYGGSQYYVHGDFGGPIDKRGKFGYRLNLFTQDGDTQVEHQHLRRTLASVAFDWHMTDRMLLQIDAAYADWEMDGLQGQWFTSPGARHPEAPDGDGLYGQPWSNQRTVTGKVGSKFTWDISQVFRFRAGYRYQYDDRRAVGIATNTFQPDGTFTQELEAWAPQSYVNHSAYGFLDSKFTLWGITNNVTTGVSGNLYYEVEPREDSISPVTLNGLTFDNHFSPPPAFSPLGTGQRWTPTKQYYMNVILGDEIIFNERWSAIVGVNWTTIRQYNAPNTYSKSAWTPTGSLIYKPLPWLSTYATYMEALDAGGIVGPQFANFGTVFPPLISRQYEVGAKATVGRMLLTAALFHIEKGNTFVDNTTSPIPTLTQDGRACIKALS